MLAGMELERPEAGPRGLTFGVLGGLLTWAAIALAALAVRRVHG